MGMCTVYALDLWIKYIVQCSLILNGFYTRLGFYIQRAVCTQLHKV